MSISPLSGSFTIVDAESKSQESRVKGQESKVKVKGQSQRSKSMVNGRISAPIGNETIITVGGAVAEPSESKAVLVVSPLSGLNTDVCIYSEGSATASPSVMSISPLSGSFTIVDAESKSQESRVKSQESKVKVKSQESKSMVKGRISAPYRGETIITLGADGSSFVSFSVQTENESKKEGKKRVNSQE